MCAGDPVVAERYRGHPRRPRQGRPGTVVDRTRRAARVVRDRGVGSDRDPHTLLRELRSYLARRRGDAVLLGEVNLPYDQLTEYFGKAGDELTMGFNFPVNQAMYLALARQDATPLAEALQSMPELSSECQWTNFVRNHDELTLDQLSEQEREEVFAAFAPEEDMRIYGRGIRRRLPGMLKQDTKRIRMVYSLMFSMPGTPTLFYGEEIGMTDNPDIPGRLNSRSPMQWSGQPHAGFSAAPEGAELVRPLPADASANVADQRRHPESLLNWMERLILQRKECPELGWGRFELLLADGPVLAHRCEWGNRAVVAIHNLGDQSETLTLPAKDDWTGLVDLFGDNTYRPGQEIEIEPYGFRWLRVHR
jgi:glycosidase